MCADLKPEWKLLGQSCVEDTQELCLVVVMFLAVARARAGANGLAPCAAEHLGLLHLTFTEQTNNNKKTPPTKPNKQPKSITEPEIKATITGKK